MRSYWKDALVILRRESKFGLLFPGQGSSIYEGMTRQLELTFPHIVKPILTKASQLLIDFPLVPAVLLQQGSLQKLIPTEIAQPAIFLTSYIHYQCLKFVYEEQLGIPFKPEILLGHSLGEFTALACGSHLDFEVALQLVRARGKFMANYGFATEDKVETCMKALIFKSAPKKLLERLEEEIQKILPPFIVTIANYNSSSQVVLSGHTEAIDLVIDRLCTNSFSSSIIKVIPLKVSAPFHCAPLMNSSANQFKEWILNWPDFKVSLSNDSQIPVLSTCTLERLHFRGTLDFVEYCERQILEPVLWKKAMDLATTHKVNVFGEIGSSTLQAISRRDFPNCQFFSIMETNF